MKRLLLLGASGSIGTQTIDVVVHHKNEFCIIGLSVGYHIERLHELLHQLPSVERVCVAEAAPLPALQKQYPHIRFYYGDDGMSELCAWSRYDMLVNAVVGFRGLRPTLTALEHDKDVALANKESLVAGGPLVKAALANHQARLYPIDSEHSAIFQCLRGNDASTVDKLIITASGGSFRDLDCEALKNVTVDDALHHPNWQMGQRITIDSATMMNKGFEVIEAHYLFDIPFERIETIIHYESLIHSMVQFQDHAILAQLGTPDMRLPIQYALMYPRRDVIANSQALDFSQNSSLHFKQPDFNRYPLLKLAYEVGMRGGNGGAVMNGADEAAVAHFLNGNLSFVDIETAVMTAVEQVPFQKDVNLSDLLKADAQARQCVEAFVERNSL